MAFRGTLVTQGRGRGLVVATGMDTELGRIAHLLTGETRAATPLQRRLGRFARRLALVILAACGVILVAGLLRGEPPLLMVMTAISLAVAAIPEALPAVVTISLALGARRMVRHNALIRRLPATETLGSVTYICADKTGTLTLNSMEAERFFIPGECHDRLPDCGATDERWRSLILAMILNNDATALEDGWTGDPTEIALLRAAVSSGVAEALSGDRWPRVGELPFDATRKRMTTLHRTDGQFVALTKGAPETVIPLCEPGSRDEALAESVRLAAEGYRVLAFAQREFTDRPAVDESLETGLAFIGLVGLMDPERPEAPGAVAESRKAGIKPVMITGDHPATALAIARRLGIATGTDEVLTGAQLHKLDDQDRSRRLPRITVYARMSPEQKIEIVRTLQEDGEFVAMTGDGVNDAPALKKANIGIAMGLKGTDVAREAADMVLLDDNFATIVAAVRAGRRIYDNIRKFVRYTMTSNTGEVLSLFIAPFVGLPLPLVPIQILWINLVTDGLPGLALTVEKGEAGLMKRPPRAPDEGIFARGLWQQALWMGTLIALLTLGTQAWAINAGSDHWQTMAFTVLTFSQLANALAVRTERESLFSIGLLSNRPLLATVLLSIGVQLAVIYVPALQKIFHTQALTAAELAVCLALPALVVVASEAEKWFVRHRGLYAQTN
jgi:Ca2+-transporting ATPase